MVDKALFVSCIRNLLFCKESLNKQLFRHVFNTLCIDYNLVTSKTKTQRTRIIRLAAIIVYSCHSLSLLFLTHTTLSIYDGKTKTTIRTLATTVITKPPTIAVTSTKPREATTAGKHHKTANN